jgi:hypothetical protein
MLIPFGRIAAPGALPTALIVTTPEFEEFEAKWPASPPTSAATNRSERRVDQGARLPRDCEESGAASMMGGGVVGATLGVISSSDVCDVRGARTGSGWTWGSTSSGLDASLSDGSFVT